MGFQSILYEQTEAGITKEAAEAPAFFSDLNIDQVVAAVTAGKAEYDLKPFFYATLHDIDACQYRQEIFRDLEAGELFGNIQSFAGKMVAVRRHVALVDKLHDKHHKHGWFLEAVNIYCDAVTRLEQDLNRGNLRSRGLLSFREYITNYAGSASFATLLGDTQRLKKDLSTIRYCVHLKGLRVDVREYESESDYSVAMEETFAKFKETAARDYTVKLPSTSGMNHVLAQILEFVAKLFPDIFQSLDNYCAANRSFIDQTITGFDREVQFYVAYLEYISKLKHAGLTFCYPEISDTDKEVYNYEGFDIALAHKLVEEGSGVVCNDFHLTGKERVVVVSGPNQGGKTTFARTFGQLHYLAALGCPVPGRRARLFLYDRMFTHFEREEDIRNLGGKLQEELIRMHDIFTRATPSSIIIINEMITSTTLQDAVSLSEKILEQILELDLLCICVTFIDELSSLSEKTISMVSTVVPENPAVRTFKILRKPADGLAYAISIAEKYRVTYDWLKERIES